MRFARLIVEKRGLILAIAVVLAVLSVFGLRATKINYDTSLLPRVTSMLDAAKRYYNYSGIAEGTEGSVRFIIKTASIGE